MTTQDNKKITVKTRVCSASTSSNSSYPSDLGLKVEVFSGGGHWERSHLLESVEDDPSSPESGSYAADGRLSLAVDIPDVQYWWPTGQGKQSLYTVRTTLFTDDTNEPVSYISAINIAMLSLTWGCSSRFWITMSVV